MLISVNLDVPAIVEEWSMKVDPWQDHLGADLYRMFYALLKSTDSAPNDNIAVDAMKSAFTEVFPNFEIEIKKRE